MLATDDLDDVALMLMEPMMIDDFDGALRWMTSDRDSLVLHAH